MCRSDVWATTAFQALWAMGLLVDKGVTFMTAAEAREAGGTSAYMIEFVTEDDVATGGRGACVGVDAANSGADAAATHSFDAHIRRHHTGARQLRMVLAVRLLVQMFYSLMGGVDDLSISAMVSDIALHARIFPARFAARWATCRRLVSSSSEWNALKIDLIVHLYERVGGAVCERFTGCVSAGDALLRANVTVGCGVVAARAGMLIGRDSRLWRSGAQTRSSTVQTSGPTGWSRSKATQMKRALLRY
jgi:hypothetical protein